MSGEVAGYRDLVESLARKFVGRHTAEFDDLVQEGLLNVWQSLQRGVVPKATIIEDRMKNWTRHLGYLRGELLPRLDEHGNPIPESYETLLPLDDFEHLTLDPVPVPGHDRLA
jgi:DNA-directed RNA polymerase specialized sigma24 family protein